MDEQITSLEQTHSPQSLVANVGIDDDPENDIYPQLPETKRYEFGSNDDKLINESLLCTTTFLITDDIEYHLPFKEYKPTLSLIAEYDDISHQIHTSKIKLQESSHQMTVAAKSNQSLSDFAIQHSNIKRNIAQLDSKRRELETHDIIRQHLREVVATEIININDAALKEINEEQEICISSMQITSSLITDSEISYDEGPIFKEEEDKDYFCDDDDDTVKYYYSEDAASAICNKEKYDDGSASVEIDHDNNKDIESKSIHNTLLNALRYYLLNTDAMQCDFDHLMFVYPTDKHANYSKAPNQKQNNNKNNKNTNNYNSNNDNNESNRNYDNQRGFGSNNNGDDDDSGDDDEHDDSSNVNDEHDLNELYKRDVDRFIAFLMNDVQQSNDVTIKNVLLSLSHKAVQKVLDGIQQVSLQRSRIIKVIQKELCYDRYEIECSEADDRYMQQIKELQQEIENQNDKLKGAQHRFQMLQELAKSAASQHVDEIKLMRQKAQDMKEKIQKLQNMHCSMEQTHAVESEEMDRLQSELAQKHDKILNLYRNLTKSHEGKNKCDTTQNLNGTQTSRSKTKSKRKKKPNRYQYASTNSNMYNYDPVQSKRKYILLPSFTNTRIPSETVGIPAVPQLPVDQMIKDCMLKYIAINKSNSYKIGDTFEVFNFGFHSKSVYHEPVYFIAKLKRQKRYSNNSDSWMINEILTKVQIMEKYSNVSVDRLPVAHTFDVSVKMKQLKEELMIPRMKLIINNTKWNKEHIYKKENNKRRLELKLLMDEFKSKCLEFIKKEKDMRLVPILMFGRSDEVYVQYIWIISLEQNIDIGVALKYNPSSHDIKVAGIHLDKELMYKQHHMLCSSHPCQHFDDFKSCINYMQIGNCDENLNRAKALKDQLLSVKEKLDNNKEETKYAIKELAMMGADKSISVDTRSNNSICTNSEGYDSSLSMMSTSVTSYNYAFTALESN